MLHANVNGKIILLMLSNAAHETDHIPIKTALVSPLVVYSNWTSSNPRQLLLDYLY